ncbi:hypothetical protein MXE77_19915 [Escherichia coli]|nr:hypothetical protein [Escherichia coli]
MARNTVVAVVIEPFMVAGELANVGDEVELTKTDAENLLYRGKISLNAGDEPDDEAE